MLTRGEVEAREDRSLAPYAMRSRALARPARTPSRSTRSAWRSSATATASSTRTAFRRLEYKTQVFVNHEGDYYRTRLTHTMEAAQITRTIARALRLNEDLAEAVALAHDLGHTPFGHAGERMLDRLMEPHGGFEHNAQSLRIVDVLEERYPDFPRPEPHVGGARGHRQALDAATTGRRSREFDADELAPCLEAQIVDFADEIAYNAHDIDDGLKSGMLDARRSSTACALWREPTPPSARRHPGADRAHRALPGRSAASSTRLVTDLIEQRSSAASDADGIEPIEDACGA